MVGRSIGRVRWRNRCQALAPSIIPASSISSPMLFSAAMNSSMNVPDVVKTASSTKADIATDGPDSQSHQLTPRKSCSVSRLGAVGDARGGRAPRGRSRAGRWNQFGPFMPTQPSTLFTAPVVLNRNSHSTVIATELVTDGK